MQTGSDTLQNKILRGIRPAEQDPVGYQTLRNLVLRDIKSRGTIAELYTSYSQGCGAGTGRIRIHLGTLATEPYSEYGSGSEYKEMKQTTQKN